MNDAHKVGRLTSKPELNISESGKNTVDLVLQSKNPER